MFLTALSYFIAASVGACLGFVIGQVLSVGKISDLQDTLERERFWRNRPAINR